MHVQQGRVQARQVVTLAVTPAAEQIVAARLAVLDANSLVDWYCRFISRWSRGLVRAERRDTAVRLSLVGRGPPLLHLRQQDAARQVPNEVGAALSIIGGLASVAGVQDGVLLLRIALVNRDSAAGSTLEIEVLVDRYAPLLLGLPLPDRLRGALYRATQVRLHRVVTLGFARATVNRLLH